MIEIMNDSSYIGEVFTNVLCIFSLHFLEIGSDFLYSLEFSRMSCLLSIHFSVIDVHMVDVCAFITVRGKGFRIVFCGCE